MTIKKILATKELTLNMGGVVYDVRELPGGIAHIKRSTFFELLGGIYGKRMTQFGTVFPQCIHVPDVEADLDKSRIAPETSFIEFARRTFQGLYQLDV